MSKRLPYELMAFGRRFVPYALVAAALYVLIRAREPVTAANVLPILLVVTVPARVLLGKTLEPSWLVAITLLAAGATFVASRAVFLGSLRHYRSASS